ncbi:hypothetical protein X743_14530 [Mesorhizobium sp. LNHC252B00]|nr:hypothetical protein X743_14530 [Mesorhizobium sp. LNHC252B00]
MAIPDAVAIPDGKATAERRVADVPFARHVRGCANVMVKTGLKLS